MRTAAGSRWSAKAPLSKRAAATIRCLERSLHVEQEQPCRRPLLPSYERCNGTPVCPGADDEIGCPVHICDTERVIPAKFACDWVFDCEDGTDEPATCAVVDCSIITGL
jgi:hypothetical protein